MKNDSSKLRVFLFLLIAASISHAQTTSSFYKELDAFYYTYVNSGKVDYEALSKNRTTLDRLVAATSTIRVSENDKLDYQAFWINAYNIHVIKSIIDFYPITSPLDKKGFFDTVKHNITGKNVTLNDIENNFLRAKFNDARVHFVLVCGALGCPPLINVAYRPELLEKQLTAQTKQAVNDKHFTRVGKSTVELSQLFEWYKADFEQNGSIIDFLNVYLDAPLTKNTKIKFYSYDWKLNNK
jgi:hypothetical protein